MPEPAMSPLVIFEGPDGGGKTTLAKALSNSINGDYVHHGPYLDIEDGRLLAEKYIDSLMPARLGNAPVVLDRSWISEVPYGLAFRDGADRIGPVMKERLELLARHAIYVWCLPSWESVQINFVMKTRDEYLNTAAQLYQVYEWYSDRENWPKGAVLVINPLTMNQNDAITLIGGFFR